MNRGESQFYMFVAILIFALIVMFWEDIVQMLKLIIILGGSVSIGYGFLKIKGRD